MKIVSFYSDVDDSNFYSDCAEKLKQKLDYLGLEYVIKNKSFGNNWIDNVRAKPLFLQEMMIELNEDFIWLDIDCSIIKKIDFTIKSNWGVLLREDGTPHDFVHYVSNTKESKKLISKWIEQIDIDKKGSHSAFNSIVSEINYSEIPTGYFEIGLSEVKSKQEYFKL